MQLIPHLKTPFTLLLIIIIIYSCVSMFLPSCNIINPSEKIPAYIQIDSPAFQIKNSTQGTSSQKITDSWVYVNYNLQGVYEMPKKFPVLETGTQEIIVAAGVIQNGVAGTRIAYPFFNPDTFVVNLQSKETYHFKPTFTYKDSVVFLLNEDFESGNKFVKLGGDTTLIRLNDFNVFEGTWCGLIKLDSVSVGAECNSTDTYPFNNNGSQVYIELNYKCNQKFEIGVLANTNGSSIKFYNWNITPKDNWSKIYLNLTEVLQSIIPDNYGVLIRVEKDSSVTTSNVYIDNLKLITFL